MTRREKVLLAGRILWYTLGAGWSASGGNIYGEETGGTKHVDMSEVRAHV